MKFDKVLSKWLNRKPKSRFESEGSLGDPEIQVPDAPEMSVERLKRVSDNNLNMALDFMHHRYSCCMAGLEKEKAAPEDLMRIIMDPGREALSVSRENLNEIYDFGDEIVMRMHHGVNGVEKYIDDREKKRLEEERSIEALRKKYEESLKGKYQNSHILENIGEGGVFESKLLSAGIRCALILTDTFYTRDTVFYGRIKEVFERNKIPFVEFTNIQPNLDKKLLFRMYEFANDHDVNTIVAVGSMSTVELSKLLMPKLMKPNIVRLHKNREFDAAMAGDYSIFSVPTFVVPDPKVNSRSAVKNNFILPDNGFFDNVLYLKNEIDDADGVFYCSDVFDHLSLDKITQALHELFFRLVFSYFDLSASEELLSKVIANIKEVSRLLDVIGLTGQFGKDERYSFMKVVSFAMDGRLVVDSRDFWLLYKLEGALSLMVNSRKSDGLALFMPVFFEIMGRRNQDFNARALQFGSEMYGVYSIEGCVFRLSMHVKGHGLPLSLLDVEQVKKVDYKFLSALLRKARVGFNLGGSLSREILNTIRIC